MSTPIACPRCNNRMSRQLGASQNLHCDVHGWMTEDYVLACDRSVDLETIQISPTSIRVETYPGDAYLIDVLFELRDRQYVPELKAHIITNLPKYAHLKCIQAATSAYLKQYSFLENLCES